MPNDDGWKETFKFFVKELKEVYLPQLKEIWDLTFPVSPPQGEPEEAPGEVPQPVPAPLPSAPYAPPFPDVAQRYFIGGEPPIPYDLPEDQAGPLNRTPFPPWDPFLPYGYRAGTPTPYDIAPYPTPWWENAIPGDPNIPWWRQIPPELFRLDTHIVQAPPRPDAKREA